MSTDQGTAPNEETLRILTAIHEQRLELSVEALGGEYSVEIVRDSGSDYQSTDGFDKSFAGALLKAWQRPCRHVHPLQLRSFQTLAA